MLIIAILLIVIIGMFIIIGNRIIRLKNRIASAAASVVIQARRRYDLIPDIMAVVRRAGAYESTMLDDMANRQVPRDDVHEAIIDDSELSTAMVLLVERYPSIQSTDGWSLLNDELTLMEENLSACRSSWVRAVREYDDYIGSFPMSFMARMMNATAVDMRAIDDETKASRHEPKPEEKGE